MNTEYDTDEEDRYSKPYDDEDDEEEITNNDIGEDW